MIKLEGENLYNIFREQSQRKIPLKRQTLMQVTIKIRLRETGPENTDWINIE